MRLKECLSKHDSSLWRLREQNINMRLQQRSAMSHDSSVPSWLTIQGDKTKHEQADRRRRICLIKTPVYASQPPKVEGQHMNRLHRKGVPYLVTDWVPRCLTIPGNETKTWTSGQKRECLFNHNSSLCQSAAESWRTECEQVSGKEECGVLGSTGTWLRNNSRWQDKTWASGQRRSICLIITPVYVSQLLKAEGQNTNMRLQERSAVSHDSSCTNLFTSS